MIKGPVSKVLVYLDGSEDSISALMYSILLSKTLKAELHAAYVVNTKALSDLVRYRVFIDMEKDEYLSDLHKDSERHLRHAEKLAQSKGVDITTVAMEGSPHREILSYVKENDVDLLIMGSVSAIKSRREEMLSENDRMLRTADCPVLMVRDREEIWEMFEESV